MEENGKLRFQRPLVKKNFKIERKFLAHLNQARSWLPVLSFSDEKSSASFRQLARTKVRFSTGKYNCHTAENFPPYFPPFGSPKCEYKKKERNETL